ncbi:MAG: hypothetical protein QJT81_10575 [Candidatus Thiothrix putei]|uniref:Uncharacterized protein n=1 Tax=Candidatus Thiothrix putei TaxID=3080811 RepID=A0AA95KQ85_9GAMM|nr:MAG: hypothetical protein QJT81_10575 [Candidatus Thiothrix putei]
MNKLLVSLVIATIAWFVFKDGSYGRYAVAFFDASGKLLVWVFTVDGCGEACNSVTKRLFPGVF